MPVRPAHIVLAMLAAAAVVAAACRHASPPAAMTPVAAPAAAPAESPTGAVSVRFLTAGGAPPAPLPAGQRLVAPYVIARPLPSYPPEALAAGAPPATVAVRILIDTEGRVSQISDSPLAAPTPGRFAAVFRAAVESALAGWEFFPGHIDTVQPGEDADGDGTPDGEKLLQFTPVGVYYDVSFDFRVVDGRGSVVVSPPPGG